MWTDSPMLDLPLQVTLLVVACSFIFNFCSRAVEVEDASDSLSSDPKCVQDACRKADASVAAFKRSSDYCLEGMISFKVGNGILQKFEHTGVSCTMILSLIRLEKLNCLSILSSKWKHPCSL